MYSAENNQRKMTENDVKRKDMATDFFLGSKRVKIQVKSYLVDRCFTVEPIKYEQL